MGYSKEHTERTRQRILDCAGRAFRKHGYDGVGIDRIMADAGLTRGGFYAHFRSKKTLFSAVVARDFDFTIQVKKLASAPAGQIPERAFFAAAYYLAPEHSAQVSEACTMVTSAVDVARADPSTKEAFGASFDTLEAALSELFASDGIILPADVIKAVIATCVGALVLARAMPEGQGTAVLAASKEAVAKLVSLGS